MRSMALIAAVCLGGCPTASKPDREASGLVKATVKKRKPIDSAKATKDVVELLRALRTPHHVVGSLYGPHKFSGTSRVELLRGDKSLQTIDENVVIELAKGGDYHAVRNLSGDHGREVIYKGGLLYLRPRYNKFHRRKPESKREPRRLRDQFFSTLAEYIEPLSSVLDIGKVSDVQFAGRDAYRVDLATADSPRRRPKQPHTQRKWRETILGGSVTGHVILDRKSGVALAAKLNGEVTFMRKGERLRMKIRVGHALTDLGKAVAIATPPAEQTVDTLQRRRETDERDKLLKGIAPPAGKTAIPSN